VGGSPTFLFLGAVFLATNSHGKASRDTGRGSGGIESPGNARLRAAAARVADSHGLELFDLQFRRESIGWVLRVIVDRAPKTRREERPPRERGSGQRDGRPNGEGSSVAEGIEEAVGIEDCQHVSRDLSALLDVDDELSAALGEKYTLEVSSPGLDRPLRGEADYRRFEGRLAKIVTAAPVDGQTSFAGRLSGVEDGVILLTEGRRVHRVRVGAVKRARLEVEF